jgi:hypothetical protein
VGNLLIAKGLIVTRWIGFSEGSSSLPIANVPPGIDTISGISWDAIGAAAGVGDALSLGASTGALAGAGVDRLSLGVPPGAGAGSGCDVSELPLAFRVSAASPQLSALDWRSAFVGAKGTSRPG